MMHLSIKNAAISINGKTILEEINFEIKNNEHIGIVGRNGVGKTTFLRAIIDNTLFESGIGEEKFVINKIGNYKIGYLKQIDFDDEENTLLREIEKPYQNLIKMAKKIDDYLKEMEKNNDPKIIMEYTNLLEDYKLQGGYSYQKEYEVMLHKFGFKDSDKFKKIKEFSGGQKTKIAFMKLLLSKPDLLILDEPTNHLDISTITWLEEYLKKYKGAIILVSHDRMFMDNIVDIIYDIEYGKMLRYKGNYAFYEKEKQKNYEKALSDYEYQQKEIKRLRGIYERFRYKPSKASLAMSRLHQLEKMDILEKPRKEDTKVFKTNLEEIKPSGTIVFGLKNVTFGYDKPLAKLNMNILAGMKIGIVGPNGIGKSTILKTLKNLLSPISGKIALGSNIKIGYFDQSLAMINSKQTVLEEFQSYLPDISYEKARSALGSFLFKGDDVFKTIDVLSGGEKVRLQLCKILYDKPNVLILDEATNHLDIVGKEYLENILVNYPGTIIFVSHDRYFIKKIATKLLIFENDDLHFYNCNYEEYLENKKQDFNVEISKNVKIMKVKKERVVNKERDLQKLEKAITKLEQQKEELKNLLFDPLVYANKEKSDSILNEIKEIEEKLKANNKEWEELAKLLEI